jgi:twitching motility protein PilT
MPSAIESGARAPANRIDSFLELVVNQQGSDLHLVSGLPPRIRLYGDLLPVRYRELSCDETESLLRETMTPELLQRFASSFNLDYAYEVPGLARFRVHTFRHLHGMGAVFRLVPNAIRTLEELGLPAMLATLCRERRGLVLVTGPTGSGKSTTLAAMIDFINGDRKGHIITLEDPVEFVHRRKGCLISQREIGVHARGFAPALLSALREDPDVILVGELRDLETMSLAVTAAETGVLILATLHTNGAVTTVERMINAFPPGDRQRIRAMLATSLSGVISQQLVRRADGRGQLAAVEVLLNNPAVANLIRDGKPSQLAGVLERSALVGMQSLDNVLRGLLDAKLITGDEAHRKAVRKQDFAAYQLQQL